MAQPQYTSSLSADEQRTLDNVLQRYRTVWKPGELQRWQEWLPKPGSALRLPMLLGLVRIDLHRHWQQGQRPTVESYLQRFPELREHSQAETLLIQTEYTARSQAGMPVDVPAMARRFQLPVEQLQQLLGLPSQPHSTGTDEDEPDTRLIARPPEDEPATRLIASPTEDEPAARLVARPAVPSASPVALLAPRRAHAIRRSRRWLWWVAALSVCASLLLLAGVVYLVTDHGTVQIELNDPDAQVAIQLDGSITLNEGKRSVRLRAGEHGLVVTGKDYETVTRSFSVRRGKKTLVRVTLHRKEKPVPGKKTRGPVDLLACVDVQRDALRGPWGRQGKALLSPALTGTTGTFSCLPIPYALPEEYDLTLIAQRTGDPEALLLWFEFHSSRALLVLDGWGGGTSGLELIDGKKADSNETTWKGQVFPPAKPVQVDLSVRKDRITVVSRGRTLIDWKAKPVRLQDSFGLPTTSCVVLGSWQTAFRISKLSLRPVSKPREPHTTKWTPDQIVARHVLFRGGAAEVTTKAGPLGCRQVSNLPAEPYRLRAVRLDQTDYSWDGQLAHLPVVASLEVFSADRADIGDAALSYLSQLKGLRELSVVGTRMTEKALADLGQLAQLRLLRIGEGQFSDKALQQFQAKLPKCQVKKVSADRVAAEAVLSRKAALQQYPAKVIVRTADGKEHKVNSIRQLPRTSFRVTSLAMPQLVRVPGWRIKAIRNLPELERLFFWANSLSSKDLLTMQNLPKLQDIQLGWNGIDEEAALHLSRFQQLRGLHLVATRCNDACLKHLKNLKQLRGIYLTRTPITDAGCQYLAEMTSLQTLELDQTRIGDAAIEHLVKMQSLRELRIRRTKFTQEGLDRLRKALPRCKVVAK